LPITELPESGRVNIARIMRPAAFSVISRAFDRGLVARQDFFLGAADRLLGLAQVEEGLRRLDVKPKEFRAKLDELLAEHLPVDAVSHEKYLENAEALAIAAFAEAFAAGHNFIEASDLFSALAKLAPGTLARLFKVFSIDPGDLERALIFSSVRKGIFAKLPRALSGFTFESNRRLRHRVMNRAWTSRPTPTLDRYSTDLTDLARESMIGFLIGHDTEYSRLVETLGRRSIPMCFLWVIPASGKRPS